MHKSLVFPESQGFPLRSWYSALHMVLGFQMLHVHSVSGNPWPLWKGRTLCLNFLMAIGTLFPFHMAMPLWGSLLMLVSHTSLPLPNDSPLNVWSLENTATFLPVIFILSSLILQSDVSTEASFILQNALKVWFFFFVHFRL